MLAEQEEVENNGRGEGKRKDNDKTGKNGSSDEVGESDRGTGFRMVCISRHCVALEYEGQ